jgi:hypothetical protein
MSGAGGSPPRGLDYQGPNYHEHESFTNFVGQCQSAEIANNHKDTRVTVMGLALYNTDGPGYPFTCG